jgi:hypothetical protein
LCTSVSLKFKASGEPGMVVHACSPSTQEAHSTREAQAVGLEGLGQPGETLSQKSRKKNKIKLMALNLSTKSGTNKMSWLELASACERGTGWWLTWLLSKFTGYVVARKIDQYTAGWRLGSKTF